MRSKWKKISQIIEKVEVATSRNLQKQAGSNAKLQNSHYNIYKKCEKFCEKDFG